MRPEDITNFNGNPIILYDLDDLMGRLWDETAHDDDIACVTSPYVRQCISRIFRKYQPDDKRDPSTELAYIRNIATRWGAMHFHVIDYLPSGTIYFVRESEYPGWKEAIDKTVALFTNVGMFDE